MVYISAVFVVHAFTIVMIIVVSTKERDALLNLNRALLIFIACEDVSAGFLLYWEQNLLGRRCAVKLVIAFGSGVGHVCVCSVMTPLGIIRSIDYIALHSSVWLLHSLRSELTFEDISPFACNVVAA